MRWYEDKEYWDMCEGAKKLQKQKKLIEFGDYYIFFDDKTTKQEVKVWSQKNPINRETRIWLPSQEDLQEIYCKEKNCKWVDFLLDFHRWLYGISDPQNSITKTHIMQALAKKWNSETQLKLAFVMDRIFDKLKWNPETKKWENLKSKTNK